MFNDVLVTGGTGFLGKILVSGFEGCTTSLGRSADNLIVCDLSVDIPKIPPTTKIIIHNAGKAHVVPRSLEQENEFFKINVTGTKHLLEGIDRSDARLNQLVFISTVAVYGQEIGSMIDEQYPLKGNTPYALSKIQAEELVVNWGTKNQIPVLIFRLPLIVGENPPGNLGKMILGIKKGKYFSINKGRARRSLVLGEDIANCIKENIGKNGIYNLTDGVHPSFKEIETVIVNQLGVSLPINLPSFLAIAFCCIGDKLPKFPFNSSLYSKMANDLTFNDVRARNELNWKPRNTLDYFKITKNVNQ